MNLVFARFTTVGDPLSADARARHAQVPGTRAVSPCSISSASADYHGDDEDMRRGRRGRRPRRSPTKATPRRCLPLDVDDHIDPTTREWITLDEDGNWSSREAPTSSARPSSGARFEAWLLAQQTFTPIRTRWLRLVRRADPGQCRRPGRIQTLTTSPSRRSRYIGGVDAMRRASLAAKTDLNAALGSLNAAVFPADTRRRRDRPTKPPAASTATATRRNADALDARYAPQDRPDPRLPLRRRLSRSGQQCRTALASCSSSI